MCNNQYGRSMIEMLGVLSIIGILSVGGLAGFSEVITRHRVNKTVEQVITMASNLSQIGEQSGSYEGLSNDVAIRMKAISGGVSVSGSTLTNIFGGDITIEPSGLLATTDTEAFAMTYTGLSSDVCIRLATQKWQSGQSGSLLGVGFAASEDGAASLKTSIILNCAGVGCAKSLPISITDAISLCNCSGDDCVMVVKYY